MIDQHFQLMVMPGPCAAVRDFDFWHKVGTIRTHTLVIAGTHDQSVPLC